MCNLLDDALYLFVLAAEEPGDQSGAAVFVKRSSTSSRDRFMSADVCLTHDHHQGRKGAVSKMSRCRAA